MKTVADILRRFDEKKRERRIVEPYWKDAFDYTDPVRGLLFNSEGIPGLDFLSSAVSTQARIYDSTLGDACDLLAAALVSGLTPSNSRWFGHKMVGMKDVPQDGKEWLDEAANTIWEAIHDSNYDMSAYQAFGDYTKTGMFAVLVEEGDYARTGKLFNFRLWPLAQCYFGDSTGSGKIDIAFRWLFFTAEQAINEFGEEGVSEQIRKAYADNKLDTTYPFVHAVYPRGNDRKRMELPIASVYIEQRSRKQVRKSGYHEMPVIVPRHLPIPGSVYSLGPANRVLPDAKTLNELVRLVVANADMAVSGMYGATDDGVLNARTVQIGPRKIVIMASKESMWRLDNNSKFDVAFVEQEKLQQQIRRGLRTDQLQIADGPQMTAEEVRWRKELNRQILAPMFASLQPEYLSPLVERCFGIAYRAGILGKPPSSIANGLSKTTYQSPLALAQKLEDVAAMDSFEQHLAVLAEKGLTQVVDLYDIDEAQRVRAELRGVPAKLIRDGAAVKKLRKDREAAIAQARQQEQQARMQEKTAPELMKGVLNNAA